MKGLIKLLLGFAFLTLLGCGNSNQISKEEKKAILGISTKIMEASVKGDIPRVMSYLDKGITINVSKEGKKPYSYDYNGYNDYLINVFSLIDSYSYTRRAEKFSTNEAGQIQFEFELDEKYSFRGKEINENHFEKWTIIKRFDSFLILRIDTK